MKSMKSLIVAVGVMSALVSTQSWAHSHRSEKQVKPWKCYFSNFVGEGETKEEAQNQVRAVCMGSPENYDIQACQEYGGLALCALRRDNSDPFPDKQVKENPYSRSYDSGYSREDRDLPSEGPSSDERMETWSCRFANYLGTGMSQDDARTALSSSCMVQGMPSDACLGYASAASCESSRGGSRSRYSESSGYSEGSRYSQSNSLPSSDRAKTWRCSFTQYSGSGVSLDAARTALKSSCMVQGMPVVSCEGYASAASCSAY